MGKMLRISLKLKFTPSTLGCYELMSTMPCEIDIFVLYLNEKFSISSTTKVDEV